MYQVSSEAFQNLTQGYQGLVSKNLLTLHMLAILETSEEEAQKKYPLDEVNKVRFDDIKRRSRDKQAQASVVALLAM
jgi:hypothetical protein